MRGLLVLMVLLMGQAAWALDLGPLDVDATVRVLPSYSWDAKGSPFFVPRPYARLGGFSSEQTLELSTHYKGLNFTGMAGTDVDGGGRSRDASVLNELFYEGQLDSLSYTIGKKITTWGVGHGYRPLDVVQREDRQRLYPTPLEGIWQASVGYYGAEDAINLVYANPGRGPKHDVSEDESIGLNYFRSMGPADMHGVLRWSHRNQMQGGVGTAYVLTDAFEWHGEWLYQQRWSQPVPALPDLPDDFTHFDPDDLRPRDFYDLERHRGAQKAVLGGSWAWNSGWSLLGEAWYDGTAFTKQQWRKLVAMGEVGQYAFDLVGGLLPQRTLVGDTNLVRGGGLGQDIEQQNVLRTNYLLVLSQMKDGRWLNWVAAVQGTPEDGGLFGTLSLTHKEGAHTFGVTWRQFGGPKQSSYGALPMKGVVLLSWAASF